MFGIDPIIIVSIVGTIGTIISILLFQRGSNRQWFMRMDYKQAEYNHKEKMAEKYSKRKIELENLKRSTPAVTGNTLSQLANIDLDQVQDVLEKVEGIQERTGEEGGLMGLLNSPLVKGIISGLGKKEDKKPPEVNGGY